MRIVPRSAPFAERPQPGTSHSHPLPLSKASHPAAVKPLRPYCRPATQLVPRSDDFSRRSTHRFDASLRRGPCPTRTVRRSGEMGPTESALARRRGTGLRRINENRLGAASQRRSQTARSRTFSCSRTRPPTLSSATMLRPATWLKGFPMTATPGLSENPRTPQSLR